MYAIFKLKKITNKRIFIIIGKRNKNKNKILAIKKENFLFIDKYTNLNLYLRKCNIAIVAGGSIVWETLYNKLNTIVIPTARNQYPNIKNLEKDKIIQTLYLNKLNENALKSIIFQKKINLFKNIVDGNRHYAIYLLKSIFFVRYEYSVIMILLIMHVPLKIILKVLNR